MNGHRSPEAVKEAWIAFQAGRIGPFVVTSSLGRERLLQIPFWPREFTENRISIAEDEDSMTTREDVENWLCRVVFRHRMVSNFESFETFLPLAAASEGDAVNTKELAKKVGVSHHRIREYFQVLLDTGVATFLPGWSRSGNQQMRTTPRFFLRSEEWAENLRSREPDPPFPRHPGGPPALNALRSRILIASRRKETVHYWKNNRTPFGIDLVTEDPSSGEPKEAWFFRPDGHLLPEDEIAFRLFRSCHPDARGFVRPAEGGRITIS